MALELTEYELIYSTYLWIFKEYHHEAIRNEIGGVTLPDFMKIFHENFSERTGVLQFFYKTYNLHEYEVINIFLLEPPNLYFLRKEFWNESI